MGKRMGRHREGKKMSTGGNVAKNYAHSSYVGEMKKSTVGDSQSFPEIDRVLGHDNAPITHISTVKAMHGKSPMNMDVMAKGGRAMPKMKMKMGGCKKMAAGGVGKMRKGQYD